METLRELASSAVPVESTRQGIEILVEEVAVDRQREGCGAVAQDRLDCLW